MEAIPKRLIDQMYELQSKINFLESNTKVLEQKLDKANKEVERLLDLRYPTSNKIDSNFEKL
jgi:glycyl-tRNA synthetase alpha subunit